MTTEPTNSSTSKKPIPPLGLALALALAMKWTASLVPSVTISTGNNFWFALPFIILGLIPLAGATYLFIQARTTVNPTTPKNSSNLITNGIFQYTRNPMYLGLLLCLIGWSLWLENIITIGGAVVFYWYINKHQIPFEEVALAEKFTEKFQQFCEKTRRWL